MTDFPLVSIIMPCFNSARVILASIDSVLNQTYSHFELIIIDDFSTDNIYDVIDKYSDERIIYIKNCHDKGVSGARQTGLEYSNGEYIAFLDSDDIWLPSKLTVQLNFMRSNNIVFSYSDYFIFHSSSASYDEIISSKMTKYVAPDILSYEKLTYGCPIGCLTVIVKSAVLAGITFKPIYKEDYVFWLDILRNDVLAYNCGAPLACYRKFTSTLSSNKFLELKRQYHVIRNHEKNSILNSMRKVFVYAVNGLIKHLYH